MGISVRKSIAWPPEPHSEPTSTIVLTSPRRWFVDVRLLRDGANGTAAAIDWAFAGTSSTENGRSFWSHWVDNRVEDATGITDEGVCTTLPDGNVLETGEMANPATGQVAPYEEIWTDLEPVATTAGSSEARCVVLQVHEDAAGTRGVVERLGQFCQGVLRTQSALTVERWVWEAGQGWQQTFRYGAGALPCRRAMDDTRPLAEGEAIEEGGLSWTVLEVATMAVDGKEQEK